MTKGSPSRSGGMVLVVVPVSILTQIATGSGLANALAGVVLVPYLAGSSPHIRLARFRWAVLGLYLLGSALLVTATGTTSDSWMALLVVSVLAASDTRPVDAVRRR